MSIHPCVIATWLVPSVFVVIENGDCSWLSGWQIDSYCTHQRAYWWLFELVIKSLTKLSNVHLHGYPAWLGQRGQLLCLQTLLLFLAVVDAACEFPVNWRDSWLTNGHMQLLPIQITANSFSRRGNCVMHNGDNKYLVVNQSKWVSLLHRPIVSFFKSKKYQFW